MMKARLFAFLLTASLAFAANDDSSLFNALKWRNIGPIRGGRSLTSSGSPSRPLEYYFGAVGGGLWKTVDGGTTWKPVTDGQIKSSSVGAVAVSESNPDIVYIGMGETELRGNIMQGDGVYKSVDAGKTWKHVGLADTQAISRIRIDPKNPDIVYVAALGHPYGPNTDRGVFRSTDGGQTWNKVLFRDAHSGAEDLTLDPHNPKIVYAALWDVYRTPWLLNDGGPGSGLFKSTDGGDHWAEITRNPGLPQGIIGKIGIAVSPVDSNRLYAMVEANDGGLFLSNDAGATWTLASQDRRARQRAFYYSRIYADPKEKDTIYIMNVNFLKSKDAGKKFTIIRAPHGDNHDLWIDPANNQRMINSNDGGGTVSVDGGETWTPLTFPTAQLYHVATTTDIPYQVCGAQQDNTTVCVQSAAPASAFGSIGVFAPYYAVGGGESGYIAPDPTDPNIIYAGSQGALLTRFNRMTASMRDVQVYPLFFSGQSASTLKERWQWTYPIVFSPVDPKIIYTSSQHLWKTTNQGQSWQVISPDLTRADPKTLGDSGGPITKDQNGPEIYGTIFTIAPSHQDANTIWTGSDDGLAYITRDGGAHWDNITPKGLPDFARISMIDASPHNVGSAFLAAKRYQLDDRKPYMYKTHDFGKTWTKITNGIPDDDFAHVVREDPKRAGLLYAGTEHGIFVSFDDGANWRSLRLNLPDTQIADLVIQDNDLIIATHGRSFYILDDIDILRQYEPNLSAQAMHLFAPDAAIRTFHPAIIDYYLQKEADKVEIDILDSKGTLVRSITASAEDEKKKRAGAEDDSDFMGPRQHPPERKAGSNRFIWDLRYPGATVFQGEILWSARAEQGPLALPGQYQVRVIANGQTQTQPLTVTLDPREHVTQAQLEEQFKLASQVRDEVSKADEMVIAIRKINKELKDRADQAKDETVSGASAGLRDRLSTIEEDLYQVRNRANQDPLNFPIKLNNILAALARTVETGDYQPTEQDYEVFRVLTERLQAIEGKYNDALSKDLAHFNEVLTAHKLPQVQPEQLPSSIK
ncbi:MAG TPA: glycosyl hydrolase [Bryobacteraceae bacterium]|nr:glycosyl hydrolase [Bryobacteraceae bacterium]